MQESIFGKVPQFVDFFVIFALYFAVFTRRNHGFHALFFSLLHDRIAIIAAISQQIFGGDSFDQAARLRAIRSGTFRNNNSDRHTKRIHGQM